MCSHARRPNLASYQARGVRLGMPKSVPVTSLGDRSSFMRANRRHGPSSPRGLRSTILMLVICSSFRPNAVASPLWPPPTISTSSDPGAVAVARDRPLARRDSSDTSARAAPDPRVA